MKPAIDFRLYLVTDRQLCAPRRLDDVVREACAAGVRAVEMREKDLDARDIDKLARKLAKVTDEFGATLFINQEHPTDAVKGAGLHFPESVAIVRPGPGILVGASTHSHKSADTARAAGADFVTFGPVFETPAKVRYGPPQGLERLAEIVEAVNVPVFAIGGVTPERVRACVDAGAYGIAVMGGIMAAENVAAVVHRYEKALWQL